LQLGISSVFAEVLPAGKVDKVAELQAGSAHGVAMVSNKGAVPALRCRRMPARVPPHLPFLCN
jgi:hypothetical protein